MSTNSRVRFGALAITTAALAVAGCGGSSSKSASSAASTASTPASTASTPASTASTPASTAPAQGSSAQFTARAHALIVAFQAAGRQFQLQGQSAGANLQVLGAAAKAFQVAANNLADGLAALTPPAGKAAAAHDYIVLVRDFASNMGKLGGAAASNDQAGVKNAAAAIKTDGTKLDALNARLK